MASAVTSRDDGLCVDRGDRLGRAQNSTGEKRRAALLVADRCAPGEVSAVLQALGLAPYSRAVRRKPSTEPEARAARAVLAPADPSIVPHGTASGYDYWGCRCLKCANTRAARDRARNHTRRSES